MNNPFEAPVADLHAQPGGAHEGPPVRHGCLTAWLIFMLIANSAAALANLAMGEQISAVYPAMPSWGLPVLALGGVVNVVCAAALLNWRKWGFFGFIATTVVGTSVNAMAGLPVTQLALGLVGIVVLYGVMQIGEPTGWSQMR